MSDGHAALLIADKPRSCLCIWRWSESELRNVRSRWVPGCPWHTA